MPQNIPKTPNTSHILHSSEAWLIRRRYKKRIEDTPHIRHT